MNTLEATALVTALQPLCPPLSFPLPIPLAGVSLRKEAVNQQRQTQPIPSRMGSAQLCHEVVLPSQ